MNIDIILCNFLAYASGVDGTPEQVITYPVVDYRTGTFEQYLAAAQDLAATCGIYAYEAIQYIIKDVVEISDLLKKQEDEASPEKQKLYKDPKDVSKRFGMTVQAMAQAFDVGIVCEEGRHTVTIKQQIHIQHA